ncbi:MAG: hypothetical protein PHE54_05290 [Bacilli bacterium]|nr:hypothetical protein [Bacilli bacterium]
MRDEDVEIIDLSDDSSNVDDVEIIDIDDSELNDNNGNANSESIIFDEGNEQTEAISNVHEKRHFKIPFIPIITIIALIAIVFIVVKIISGFGTDYQEKLRQVSLRLKTSDMMVQLGETYSIEIESDDNNLKVYLTSIVYGEDYDEIYNYVLENNILSISLANNDYAGRLITMGVIDAVGQINGYEENELYNYFTTISDYSTLNLSDGIEYSEGNDTTVVKINIDKKYPIPDDVSYAITADEINNDYFIDEEFYNYNNAKIKLYKVLEDDKVTIYIYEKGSLTNDSYKTLLNVISVLYNDKLIDFKNNFTKITSGTYDKFTIETEYNIEDSEVAYEDLDNYVGFRLIVSNESA